MKDYERQLVVDQLTASRDRLLELVDSMTAEEWAFRPAEGRWSTAECLEHVVRVERRVLGLIETKLGEEPSLSDKVRVDDALVARAVPDRTNRREAPEPVRPTGQWPNAGDLLDEFRKTRQRSADFAATTQGDLRNYFIPHMALGELDCYQWLLLLSLHGSRHAQQIEEIKATDGFPRPTVSLSPSHPSA